MAKILVEIGGWSVSLDFPGRPPRLEPSYGPFLVPSAEAPSAEWRVNREPFPPGLESPSPSPRWRIEERDGSKVFRLQRWLGSPDLWKAARMTPDLSRGEIWADRSEDSSVHPLREIDQLIFAHFFVRRRGLIVHAAAASVAGRGYLFPAPGGSGKSTWSALLSRAPGCVLLGDDKVVLRGTEGGVRIHSTPWNPTLGLRMSYSAPLAGICFLRHGEKNDIRPLTRAETFRNLLQQAFLPFDALETEAAASLLEAATAGTDSYGFSFRPDQSAVDYFLSAIAGPAGTPRT